MVQIIYNFTATKTINMDSSQYAPIRPIADGGIVDANRPNNESVNTVAQPRNTHYVKDIVSIIVIAVCVAVAIALVLIDHEYFVSWLLYILHTIIIVFYYAMVFILLQLRCIPP